MGDKSVWDKEIPVPRELIEYIDPGVREKLPPGTQVHGISPSGSSYWARTAKIEATDAAGNPTPFFIKVLQSDTGKATVSAEHRAMTLLHSVKPDLVVEPIAWGAYTQAANTYFFVCRFHAFAKLTDANGNPAGNAMADPASFAALVSDLHLRGAAAAMAVGGMFGFPLTMYGGRNPQIFPLCKTWEECFSLGIGDIFDREETVQGVDGEMRALRVALTTKIIPRLLRPLETGGRKLVPTLVHGDLWQGNVGVEGTGRPLIFDATPVYAHNEYELGPWWPERHKEAREYIAEYKGCHGVSEPKEDLDDRVKLYAIRFDIHASSLYPGNLRFRVYVKDAIKDLLQRHSLGYEGYVEANGVPSTDSA
ncbi:hypothetical protein C8A05DRAFT_17911 [Staphylotrichum tortipilum]|uniref:protein-ribulosamine 3-kinase n=1 Tax=Staphylotrichum tortipilum TaxID=2831512 RepID=A0AAN6MF70_9PEZI|nr:hypothetical protein C8A05DRAFT_17911 [Staphylotrichum longicolle]